MKTKKESWEYKVFKELWKSTTFKILFSVTMCLLILDVVFYYLIISTENETLVIVTVMLNTLTTFTSSIIALTIPFLMKGIDKREKKEEELKQIKLILQKTKSYFKISFLTKNDLMELEEGYDVPATFPFFQSLNKKYPMLLAKIGILYVSFDSKTLGEDTNYLHILDRYRFYAGSKPRLNFKVIGGKRIELIKREQCNKVLIELINNVEKNFSMKLDESEFLIKDNSLKPN